MQKPIICFEGPSSIGKTTMSKSLSADHNIVPEVNLLFERSANEPSHWYLERQVDRFNLCQTTNITSILDGDIFQPVWYNWACNYPAEFLSKEKIHEFYKSRLSARTIKFPDLYIIFNVDEKELWIRKQNDKTRRRRNFEKHLNIIEPLKEYYRFLNKETDIEMKFIHYGNFDETKSAVSAAIENTKNRNIDGLKAFDQIEGWINTKKP